MSGSCWRVVEAQHQISTLKLVDTLVEQARLEELLEQSKPAVPSECAQLQYLLATPFRYGSPYPRGSRFRRAGRTPGVFYASKTIATAIAEMAFHRLLFFADSPATPWPGNAGEYTAFSVRYRTAAALDLTAPPLDRDRAVWRHPTEYRRCQELADTARDANIEVLRYQSARDPQPGAVNVALLTCTAFASQAPVARATWRILFNPQGVHALCAFPETRLAFDRAAFAADPRIASLVWDR